MHLQSLWPPNLSRLKTMANGRVKGRRPPLAVYIHWPYCARVCPYCDFNVYKQQADEGLVTAIIDDLSAWRRWSGPRHITSVHFGGGTPSLMRGEDIAAILDHIDRLWGLDSAAELGLEANPNNAAMDKLTAFKAAGLNRLSFGIQSFNDHALRQLGRDHDGAAALAALTAAVPLFKSVSGDLIFGWHGQTIDMLDRDLQTVLSTGVSHLSAYQLTIEDGTAFAKAEARGERRAVHDELSADLYDHVQTRLLSAGFTHYEVSNFAKPGHESRHNLAYWQGHDYVGAGPGAHGRMTIKAQKFATIAEMHPKAYQTRVKDHGFGFHETETLSLQAQRDEYVLMGLRISQGLSLMKLNSLYPDSGFDDVMAGFVKEGYLAVSDDRLFATPKGRAVLNYITEKLLAG